MGNRDLIPIMSTTSTTAESSKRHASTPLDKQRAQLEKLLKDPSKPAYIPPAPKEKAVRPAREMMKNVQGSSAGAGSGEFHVYKASRRREYERLKQMEDQSTKVRYGRLDHLGVPRSPHTRKRINESLSFENKNESKRWTRRRRKIAPRGRRRRRRLKLRPMKPLKLTARWATVLSRNGGLSMDRNSSSRREMTEKARMKRLVLLLAKNQPQSMKKTTHPQCPLRILRRSSCTKMTDLVDCFRIRRAAPSMSGGD